MNAPHSIRLRGPWEATAPGPQGDLQTAPDLQTASISLQVNLTRETNWREVLAARFPGQPVSLTRKFQWPHGATEYSQVRLLIVGGELPRIAINDRPLSLSEVAPPGDSGGLVQRAWSAEILPRPFSTNCLEIRYDARRSGEVRFFHDVRLLVTG